MNFKRIGFFFAIILFLAVYLLNRKDVQFMKQDGFKIEPISATGMEFKSVLHLYNPNLLSSTIKKVHERFIINGVLVGELDNEINQGIPGRKETEFPVSIRFTKEQYDSVIGNTPLIPATIQVEGEVVYNNFTSSGEVKVNQSTDWKP
jgi:LEA14-like dessication related protein